MKARYSIKTGAFLLTAAALLTGCISNDIPFPVVKGEFTAFEVQGQLPDQAAEIKTATREVVVRLADTTNIRRLRVIKAEYSKEAVMEPELGEYIDLSSPLKVTLKTYQDYVWTIRAEQPVDRVVNVDGQVDQVIDPVNFNVVVFVAEGTPLDAIRVNQMQLGPSNSTMTPDPTTVRDFRQPQKFTVEYHDQIEVWTVSVEHKDMTVETRPPQEVWATFAVLEGSAQTGTGKERGLEYRKAGEERWTQVSQADLVSAGAKLTATVKGLTPATEYLCRAYLGDETGEEVAFTTEAAAAIPNLNLDTWNFTAVEGATKQTWNPWKEGDSPYWYTANGGVVGYGDCNTTATDDAVGGKAARMETTKVLIALAAGNLFTGTFTLPPDLGNLVANAKFGRPFTARPLRMRFQYKYFPKVVDVITNNNTGHKNYAEMLPYKGKNDYCHVWIKLEDWGGAAERPANPVVIAYGQFYTNETVEQYTPAEVTLDYYDRTARPTHLSIVVSSSRFGDYFTGGVGSVLYVDDFELVYE